MHNLPKHIHLGFFIFQFPAFNFRIEKKLWCTTNQNIDRFVTDQKNTLTALFYKFDTLNWKYRTQISQLDMQRL